MTPCLSDDRPTLQYEDVGPIRGQRKEAIDVPGSKDAAERWHATPAIGPDRRPNHLLQNAEGPEFMRMLSDGAPADYSVALADAVPGEVGERVCVRGYPGWARSVWDLVVRTGAALNQGREALPPRPEPPAVTVHTNKAALRHVRLDEIPEPARTFFDRKLAGSGIPDHGCAYAHDGFDFLDGQR